MVQNEIDTNGKFWSLLNRVKSHSLPLILKKSDLTIGPIKQIMTGFKKAYDNTLSSQLRNFKKGTRLYLKRFFRKKNHVSKS